MIDNTFLIVGSAIFALCLAWLAWEAFTAPVIDDEDELLLTDVVPHDDGDAR